MLPVNSQTIETLFRMAKMMAFASTEADYIRSPVQVAHKHSVWTH
ncbi:hypothetical protein SAMN05216198_0931 [Halopseudomonas litoralis]|uniref:Uncharacterized protein n=1 Tax=Halopseudomonas litoralis TaxID=797277 RepID=A0A1H1NJB2_9GAMM|nr:hypothetical protein SAMN05216198_0931 [Halopseudomonas litoralis]